MGATNKTLDHLVDHNYFLDKTGMRLEDNPQADARKLLKHLNTRKKEKNEMDKISTKAVILYFNDAKNVTITPPNNHILFNETSTLRNGINHPANNNNRN